MCVNPSPLSRHKIFNKLPQNSSQPLKPKVYWQPFSVKVYNTEVNFQQIKYKFRSITPTKNVCAFQSVVQLNAYRNLRFLWPCFVLICLFWKALASLLLPLSWQPPVVTYTFFNNPRREVLSSKTLKKNKKNRHVTYLKSLSVLNT